MSIKKNRNKEKVTASGVENVQRLFHTMTPREKLFPHYKSFGKLKTTPCVLGEKTTYKGNNIRNPNREGMKHFISYLRENLGRDRGTIAVITIMNIWNATSFPSEKSCYVESERISFFFCCRSTLGKFRCHVILSTFFFCHHNEDGKCSISSCCSSCVRVLTRTSFGASEKPQIHSEQPPCIPLGLTYVTSSCDQIILNDSFNPY